MKYLWMILFLSFVFTGCSAHTTTVKNERVIKGVLLKVDRNAFGQGWKLLKFEGGFEVAILSRHAERWYIGHYQEITVDSEGRYLSNKCDSYDDLAADFRKRPYEHPALAAK